MEYLISFLEGIITFISPCLVPMLPVYVSYFAGGGENNRLDSVKSSIGFVFGFTIVFVSLGAFAGTLGSLLSTHRDIVSKISGIIVILFGLSFFGLFRLPFVSVVRKNSTGRSKKGFINSALFGMVFSLSWTPCVGAFLGSALMLAAQSGDGIKGIIMLFCYSMGLAIPFLATAILIDRLKSAFDFIKRNHRTINIISGSLLVAIGIAMATGLMGYYMSLLTF